MIPFVKKSFPLNSEDTKTQLLKLFRQSGSFDLEDDKKSFKLFRKTRIPQLKIVRILLPNTVCKFSFERENYKYTIKLDGLSFFFLIVFAIASVLELSSDRLEYPKEYPMEMPFILFFISAFYAAYNLAKTNKIVQQVLLKQ